MRATLKQELPSISVAKRQNGVRNSQKALCVSFPLYWGQFLWGGDRSFQVVWRTHLEVDLKLTQNYRVELLALFLRQMIF